MNATCRGLAALVVATAVVAALAPPAAGAGQTSVHLVPASERVPVDGTTTVDVVVTDIDGGVGALNVSVAVDGSEATVTNASVGGDAGLSRVVTADDGSSARVVAALMDTSDAGSTVVATVTVEGAVAGASDLSVRVAELADESGNPYDVTAAEGTSITVHDPSTPSPATPTTPSTSTTPPTSTPADEMSADETLADETPAATAADRDDPTTATPVAERGGGDLTPAVLGVVLVAVVALAMAVIRRG